MNDAGDVFTSLSVFGLKGAPSLSMWFSFSWYVNMSENIGILETFITSAKSDIELNTYLHFLTSLEW